MMIGKIIAYLLFCSLAFNSLGQSLSKSKPTKFLALGDSYTIGESVAENLRWPNQLSDSLFKRGFKIEGPKIIATTGWRTDNLKDAIEAAGLNEEYSLVSLLIGVNNQYQGRSVEQYGPEFKELLLSAIKLAKGKKENVFVVSIPDYGYTPFGKPKQAEISKAIDQFNEVNKSITVNMGIKYVSITETSRLGLDQPDLVAEDGLHPSGKMYSMWVERILALLVK
jgi:lysophospholipase L1-like esterase